MSVIQSEFDSVIHEKLLNTSSKPFVSYQVMLKQLATIDIIALDAAIASELPGERAACLLANRQRITPYRLPKLLITAHSGEEHQQALATAKRLQNFVDSVSVITESSRNKTAVNALALHRANWPEMSERERKARILLLSRRGGGGKPQFIAPFVGGSGTTCGTWTPIVAYQRGKTTWIAGTRSKEEERQAVKEIF